MIRQELRADLRSALFQAAQKRTAVAARGVTTQTGDRVERVNLLVRPALSEGDPARGFFLVLFEDATEAPVTAIPEATAVEPATRQLEEELLRTKARMRLTIEQYEVQAEEAKAANEELQAMNEELRSTAEELETSQEELQSVNEELQTVNQELKVKIDEVMHASDDMRNLMSSTEIGTIFVDRSMRVKLFTPQVREIFNLIPGDVGRSLMDITSKLAGDTLTGDMGRVLDRLQSIEREVQTRDGEWYLMRLLPYRTSEDRIDGVVLTFLDITERHQAGAAMRRSEARQSFLLKLGDALRPLRDPTEIARVAVELIAVHLDSAAAHYAEIDEERGVVVTHAAYAARPEYRVDEYDVSGLQALLAPLRRGEPLAIEDIGSSIELPQTLKDAFGRVNLHARLAVALAESGKIVAVFTVLDNRTRLWTQDEIALLRDAAERVLVSVRQAEYLEVRRRVEAALRDSETKLRAFSEQLEERVRERTGELERVSAQRQQLLARLVTATEEERQRIARELHDEMGQHINALRLGLDALVQPGPQVESLRAIIATIDGSIDRLTLELRPPVLDEVGLPGAIHSLAEAMAAASSMRIDVHVTLRDGERFSDLVESTLYRVLQESLTNASRHSGATTVSVIVEREDHMLRLIVEDNGHGFDVESALESGRFGLIGMRERVALVNGTLEVETETGRGTTIYVRVPVNTP